MNDLEAELEGGLAKAAHAQHLHEAELHQAAADVAELCRMLYESLPLTSGSQWAPPRRSPRCSHLAITAPALLELQVCVPAPLCLTQPCSCGEGAARLLTA